MNLSQFKFYSIGIVAANKPLNTKTIEVLANEVTPMVDGEISDNGTMYGKAGTTPAGETYHAEVATSVSIKADWLPVGNGNRLTAPDVRRGERVLIYRFGNTDSFFWEDMPENGIDLRKLETIVWAISGTIKEDAKASHDNTYYMEFSSHNKLIHLHTSTADGEPFSYDIQLNTKDGVFQVNDNAGTSMSMDSKNREIELVNSDKSTVLISKRKIVISALDSIDIKTKKLNINAETIETKAETNTVTAKTTHNGPVMLNGPLSQKGAGASGGAGAVFDNDVTIKGAVALSSSLNVAGVMTANKVVSVQAIQAPNV